MAQIKMNDSKILSDKHFILKQLDFEIRKKNGEWENQKREVFDHGNAVTALLYNKKNKTIILTKQFRIATHINGNTGGMLTETCAGLINANEMPEAAMIREIKEETGYEITQIEKVYQAYSSAGSLTEIIYFYVAPYTSEQKVAKGGGLEEESEEVEIMELPFNQVIQMMERGEIQDVKTIILLQYAQLKGLL